LKTDREMDKANKRDGATDGKRKRNVCRPKERSEKHKRKTNTKETFNLRLNAFVNVFCSVKGFFF
jgi:hypothetical protein